MFIAVLSAPLAFSALPAIPKPPRSYQPFGIEAIPAALEALDLHQDARLVGAVLIFAGLALAWLVAWLGPKLARLLMGEQFCGIARFGSRHLAAAIACIFTYAGWGTAHAGAKAALVAVEPFFVLLLAYCLTVVAIAVAELVIDWWLRNNEGSAQAAMVGRRTVGMLMVCTALLGVMRHFGYDVWTLVTALGIGSLALGLAAKDTLANTISGVVLLIDRPFRVGNRIRLGAASGGPGVVGEVVEVGLRTTKIRLLDKTLLVIPNTELCNSQVVNQSVGETIGCKLEILLEPLPLPALEQLQERLGREVTELLQLGEEDVKLYINGPLDGCLRLNTFFPARVEDAYELQDRALRLVLQICAAEGAVIFDARRRFPAERRSGG